MCLAVKIQHGGKTVFYSGDGRPTQESINLAQSCDMIVHEAFCLDGETPGHGNLSGAIDFAIQTKAKSLAVVHISSQERAVNMDQIVGRLEKYSKESGGQGFVPQSGDSVSF